MCCGRKIADGVEQRSSAAGSGWTVTYADGVVRTYSSEIAARLAASRAVNATVAKKS